MILGNKIHYKYSLNIASISLKESKEFELLGMSFDKARTFKKHIENLFDALSCIGKYLSLEKAETLRYTFIDSQFIYLQIVWMFCKESLYQKKHKIHCKNLKLIY